MAKNHSPYIFISYSSINKKEVDLFCALLDEQKLEYWRDSNDLLTGESYPGIINDAITGCSGFLLFLTKESQDSSQVRREVTIANDHKKKIIPVELGEVSLNSDFSYLLSSVHITKIGFEDLIKGLNEQLLRSIRNCLKKSPVGGEIDSPDSVSYEGEHYICIQGEFENFSLDVTGASYENGTNVTIYSRFIQTNQTFMIRRRGNKRYEIIAKHSYKALDVEQATKNVRQWDLTGAENQEWRITPAGEGLYYIQSCDNGLYLTVSRALSSANVYVDYLNETLCQKWSIKDIFSEDTQDPEEMTMLGWRYWTLTGNTDGVNNIDIAKKYFETAAEKNFKPAMFIVGYEYHTGRKFMQDYKKAFYWYQKAAEQGEPHSQCNLAILYYSGLGTNKDIQKGFYWYKKSAENGDTYAQWYLGQFYENGTIVKKNMDEAIKWYRKAAEQGHQDAKRKLRALGE